ncbi:hypothetical protein CK203_044448 [Vitis vinifera]|uniref:Retrovirus-related Pol polyprotein from transposon TNT 1-94-like beta-barrel domain-containing protein n=1 Tax=Vitis vinifera TaxID=29760 RepID=A0A438HUC4_VITVI|nr:hypothetical protein CK203_044448 [Vitis vinifera]
MHIAGRKKKGYIIERKVALAQDDPNHDEWEAEDTLVKSWLINSMTNQLMSHFAQCGMAKEVWDVVKRSYLDTFDSSQKKHGYPEWYKLKQDKRKNKKSTQVAFTTLLLQHLPFRITDHMTSHSSLLDSLMPLSIKSVQVANGTPMSILGVGNVSLSPRLLMSFVLLVPSLSNGLLSVSKITKHLNCFVTFNSTHHVFHDNLMKMTIDIDKEREGSNTPLNDTTMPSDDSSKTNPEVHVPSPLTLEIATLNLQIGDKGIKLDWLPRDTPRLNFIDYQETFAPMVKMNTVRFILSLVVNLD